MFKPGNVDAAFRVAIADAVTAHTDAKIVEPGPLVTCNGVPIAHGANDADMLGGASANFTASTTGVLERAVTPALDALYPVTKPATAAPTP